MSRLKRFLFVIMFLAGFVFSAISVSHGGTVNVQSPQGGKGYELGKDLTISWDWAGPPANARLLLYKNGQKLGRIINNIPAGIGTYTWKAGLFNGGVAQPGPGYQIKVNILNQPFMGMSGVFVLEKPKPLEIATGGSKSAIKISPGIPLIKPAELEIANIGGIPQKVCPGTTYNMTLTVVNHGETTGRFNICTVGSKGFSCSLGSPAVYEVPEKATRVFNITITPLKEYFEKDIWHGKIFLGKIKTSSTNQTITVQGSSPPDGSQTCNVGVSTSWTDQPGLMAGTLYCDSNMENHLRILEIGKDPLCLKKPLINMHLN